MAEAVTRELLTAFLEAFNRHDLDSIMSYFADDCVFYMPRGLAALGSSGKLKYGRAWQNGSRESTGRLACVD